MNRKHWLDEEIGRRFGNIVIVGRGHDTTRAGRARVRALILCDCGISKDCDPHAVKSGKQTSCGCLQGKRTKTHGLSRTKEFFIWYAMLQRCQNQKNRVYSYYGGRGIKVCERWQKFENFLADMGARPSEGLSIDRYPDNDGNYEPGNCRWATRVEQSNNRRSSRYIEFDGQNLSISQWAIKLGIKKATLRQRIDVGTPLHIAMSPAKFRGKRITGEPLPKAVDGSTINKMSIQHQTQKVTP
jgi:hypothetical protein